MWKITVFLYLFYALVLECSGQSVSSCVIPTVNPGFEQPVIGVNTWTDRLDSEVPGWRTTEEDHMIEFWKDGFNGVFAYEGSQFVELNANSASTLYQDFSTPSPVVFHVHFAHRGRDGTDVCQVYAGPPGGVTTTIIQASDSNIEWGVYNVTYTVPPGQTTTRFSFEALSSAGGNPAIGNFLDDIQIISDNGIIGPNPITVCGLSGVANTSAGGVGHWIPSSSNPGTTIVNQTPNDPKNITTISGFPALGTYTYIWQTGYCTSTLTVSVVSPPPAPAGIISNSPVTLGNTLTLSPASLSNVSAYHWTGPNHWSSTAVSPTIPNVTLANGGYYSLVTTSSNGCDSPPARTLVVIYNGHFNESLCAGDTLKLSTAVSATTYQWSGPNGFTSALQQPVIPNATAAMSGAYTMTATSGISTTTIELTDVSVYDAPIVTGLSSNSPLCEKSLLAITTTSVTGASYEWEGPGGFVQNTIVPEVVRADADTSMKGTYTVTITSSQGCASAPATITVDIINGLEEPLVSANLPVCVGDPLNLSTSVSGTAYEYAWTGPNGYSSDQQNPVLYPSNLSMSGVYNLTITVPGLHCQYPPAGVAVNVRPYPSVDAGGNLTIAQHDVKQIMATAYGDYLKYKWEPSTYLDNDSVLNPIVVHPKMNIKYRLTVTNMYGNVPGCSSYSEMTVYVPLTIPNIFSPNGDGIEDTWVIEGIKNYPNCVVQLFNRWGDLLFYSTGYGIPWDGTYQGQNVPVGTYYYVVDLKNGGAFLGGYVTVLR
ncbi:MAG: gliding motility-associated C-terminal domain-containing protein [Sphingobacteriaceae bacterium]